MEKSFIATLNNVSMVYNRSGVETASLKNISFVAHPGELVLLLGPSGSGKTTFLTILAGLQRPTDGEVTIFGRNLTEYHQRDLQKLRARHLGFIFQTFCLLDSLSVIENILIVMKFAGVSGAQAVNRANEFLERFGISHLKNAFPATLSQGEKQRVAVARALANDAELIIADEPTGSLSTQQGMVIVEFLKDAVIKEGRCIIIASHDDRIKIYADRILKLCDGELVP